MNAEDLLPLLREVAEKADVRVRREAGMPSGVMVMKGRITVAIEPGTPPAAEVKLLADALKRAPLEGIFLPPAVRDALES